MADAGDYAQWVGRLSSHLRAVLDRPDALSRRLARQSLSAFDVWLEQDREKLRQAMAARGSQPPDLGCQQPPDGWYCSREPGHEGPCAAYPSRWLVAPSGVGNNDG